MRYRVALDHEAPVEGEWYRLEEDSPDGMGWKLLVSGRWDTVGAVADKLKYSKFKGYQVIEEFEVT